MVPIAGNAAKQPDLSRPPPMSLMPKGRTRTHVDPTEFTPHAVNAWASAKSWTVVEKRLNGNGRKKAPNQKRTQAPAKEVIEIDDATSSTVSMTSGTQAALDAMRQSVQTLEADRKKHDSKIASLDNTMEQIARDVTALAEAQRKSNTEYVQIKEQILNIAQNNGDMKKEMKEMKDMIMCIANHLGGVRSDTSTQLSQQNQAQPPTQSHNNSPSQYFSQPFNQTQNQQQSQNTITPNDTASTAPEDDDTTNGDKTDDTSRKKYKQIHLPVFDTQASSGATTPRANHPSLLQQASDLSIGSDGNHATDDVDLAFMYD